MSPGFRVDELRVYAEAGFAALHAAFQDVAYAKLAADRPGIDRLALVGESRVAADHEGIGDARKIRRQALRNAVDEIVLLPVVPDIDERHHDDRETGDGGSHCAMYRINTAVPRNRGDDQRGGARTTVRNVSCRLPCLGYRAGRLAHHRSHAV